MSLSRILILLTFPAILATGCATDLPAEKHERFRFPEERVYVEEPTGKAQGRLYQALGWVRSKATWQTLDQDANNERLCKNYYNKAARSLLREAEKVGADAVIKVRSVVLLLDGKIETYPTPECSDDGAEGEILLQGIAVKYQEVTGQKSK